MPYRSSGLENVSVTVQSQRASLDLLACPQAARAPAAQVPWSDVRPSFGIAVGIGISAGAFAFFHSHLYRKVPLDEGNRIVALENWNVAYNNEDRRVLHDFVTWRDEMTSVVDIGAFRNVSASLQVGARQGETIRIAEMSASGFRLARVAPLLGRVLTADDERDDAAPVFVIGYDAWRSTFAGDRTVVGRELRIGDAVHTIVGTMPERFAFPVNHQYWTPLEFAATGIVLTRLSAVVIPAIAVIMMIVGFLAAVGPARRGLSIQLRQALRTE
jgi:hypothetical protein